MATTPPPEVPAQPNPSSPGGPSPSEPGQPQPGGPEVNPPGPDFDVPAGPDVDVPAPQPGGDPSTPTPAQPIGFAPPAAASRTGERAPGDTDDIGGTDEMGAAHGDLAGTSR